MFEDISAICFPGVSLHTRARIVFKSFSTFFLACAVCLGSDGTAAAQSALKSQSIIEGRVTEATGAVVPGAVVMRFMPVRSPMRRRCTADVHTFCLSNRQFQTVILF